MTDILNDLSTPALADAPKANLYAFFRYLQRSPQTKFSSSPVLDRWYTATPHPWFRGVVSRGHAPADDGQTARENQAYFKARAVASMTWWLDTAADSTSWHPYLLAQGFRFDNHTPGMAVDLHALHEQIVTPPGLVILPVHNAATLARWTHVFVVGYELPPDWADDLHDLMVGLGLALPMRNYLAFLNGKPVATANLFLGAGVAGVQFVATVPEARGRGIGAAVTLAPLLEARELGYRVGILQSSAMGVKVYERLGFRTVCQMDHFYWSPENSAS